MKKELSLIAIMFTALFTVVIVTSCAKAQTAYEVFESYVGKWEKKHFEEMYGMLSNKTKEEVTKQQFVTRYLNIYHGMEAKNIAIKIDSDENVKEIDKNTIKIPFTISIDTIAGNLQFSDYEVTMIKEKVNNKNQWNIVWNEKMIFPNMESGDQVRAQILSAKRGEIYDRSDSGLAINSTIYTIGIHPSKFEKDKESKIAQMAKTLDINPSIIEQKLKANKNPEYFVPIVNISMNEKEKIDTVLQLEGVKTIKKLARVYPGGEALGALIGHAASISAEELEKLKDQGYHSTSIIGKMGLEKVYEKRLRGENGGEIYIVRKKGNLEEKIYVAKKQPKNGENIKLSIDTGLQKKIYEVMNKEAGACASMDPKTGEVLALVSAPSYDSNLFTTYIPESQKTAWNKSPENEFENRFNNVYAPGSTFKLITAAIGLKKGSIDPNSAANIRGSKWQMDGSWGGYYITRVQDPGKSVKLKDAFIYSDNIYFAMAALKIGKEDFIKGCSDFGLGETLPIDFPMEKSKVLTGNTFKNDIMLADSGYGQGQVLMNPLHVALVYSTVINEGNMMVPRLDISNDKNTPKVWKEKVISENHIKILLDSLTAVVENPAGTAHDAKIEGISIAGKTGTAELKKDMNDKGAEENGWFAAMNTDNPKIVISMMIENVKQRGGSHYVVPKVKEVIKFYFLKNKLTK